MMKKKKEVRCVVKKKPRMMGETYYNTNNEFPADSHDSGYCSNTVYSSKKNDGCDEVSTYSQFF